ncbi:MAG: hypothetical protein H6718_06755 [Polyangiaceae bacterium]|nr:hypothetical protein [Polyangiaceae bacterium]
MHSKLAELGFGGVMRRWSIGLAAVTLLLGCSENGETDLFGPDTGGSSSGGSSAGGSSNSGGSSAGGQISGGSSAGGDSSGGSAGSGASGGDAGNGNAGSSAGNAGGGGNTSGGSAGSGGNAGAAGGSGGSATGGSATGGSATGGTAGGGSSTGGSAGAAGGSGGATGGSGTGGSTAGGTGGTGGVVCGPPSGMEHPALYTTLDDDSAILNPVYGNAVGANYSGDGFRTAQCQTAIRIDGSDRYVAYRQIKDGYQNFEYQQGTISFWYQPSYDHADNKNHHLFASNGEARWNSTGGIRIRKASGSNSNEFQVLAIQQGVGPAILKETTVSAANYGWKQGDWVHIEITWDFRVASGTAQNVHIYFDGVEATYGKTSFGALNFPAESEDARFFIGAWDNLDSETASGLVDEFMIWTSVVR